MTMSKKQTKKTDSKKGQTKSAKARKTTAHATPSAEGASQSAAPESRLPAVGTVIKKRDRHGQVRCECKVVETGIRYKGRDFTSLSGAAMAAADDLGLKNKTQNGFVFWGLTKPTRKLEDPVDALGKSFGRYQNLAALVTSRATDENRAAIRSALQEERQAIDELLTQVAS
jgi:hypothetical protein